jgi:hypothetical protein
MRVETVRGAMAQITAMWVHNPARYLTGGQE